jgi:RNase P subunit RPR2
MAKQIKGSICSKCKSTLTYLRLKTMDRVCRSCGNIQKIKIEEKR